MMHKPTLITLTIALLSPPLLAADNASPLSYGFQLAVERSALEGRSLGDDPSEDRLVVQDLELEIELEYWMTDDLRLFFTGALIDETETLYTSGMDETRSGLERREVGVSYAFGRKIESEIALGRIEFENQSERWSWWDEELDAIRLDSRFNNVEAMLGLAEELARESTGDDFIDPEVKDVQRVIFNLNWEFTGGHTLSLNYLDHSDNSTTYQAGQFIDSRKIDEEDADLSWQGISYLGEFGSPMLGQFEVQLHHARVSGDTTLYDLDDSVAGQSEVTDLERFRVKGSANAYFLSWSPAELSRLALITGRATGSGDGNPDDLRDRSYRQPDLQGDAEIFGELFQPELSNLAINLFGFQWGISDNVELALLRYDYRQLKLSDELRDASLGLDPSGTSKELGQEIDLVLSIEKNALELIVTIAEFDPGRAYEPNTRETSNFINIEMAYEF